MVISELLKKGVALIEGKEYSNPILESILVLSSLLKVDKTYIYTHLEKIVTKEVKDEFLQIMKRRSEDYPLQYLLNERQFMNLDLYVEEGVLIPRSETELMVEYMIDYIDENHKEEKINVLDIGVGSGAISISIAKYCPNTQVFGVDIEQIPIKVARKNKQKFQLENVSFFKGDLFQALEEAKIDEKFQIIISNPPYIRSEDIKSLQNEVRDHEPMRALDGGKDGLDFYRRISSQSKDYLKSQGMLIYEVGYDQGMDVKKILIDEGFNKVNILKDLQGHDRVVFGFKN